MMRSPRSVEARAPLAETTIYCRPVRGEMYVIGVAPDPTGNRDFQISFPVDASIARRWLSWAPAKKIKPDLVTIEPATVGNPMGIGNPIFTPSGPTASVVPIGTCQVTFFVLRLIAVIVPYGGALQGTPRGDMKF